MVLGESTSVLIETFIYPFQQQIFMGQFNHSVRHQRLYTQDNEGQEVFPKNCIPDERPKGSWTKGVKAWRKGEQGAPDEWVGWFTPPRFKKGKSKDRGSFQGLAFEESE